MNTNPRLKIIELRNYLLKPGMRQRFTDYFEEHFLDSQNVLGGYVLGQFRIKDADDKFFWIRGFTDMRSRLSFLRGFYEQSAVWKEFGSGANDMMLDSDNVYLLKPLAQNLDFEDLANTKGIIVVEFYFAKANQLDQLIRFFQDDYAPLLKSKPTLWVSEMAANDFPRLPVIQDRNLLVSLAAYADESEYQSQSGQAAESMNPMQQLIAKRSNLILYPTAKSFIGNARNDNSPVERQIGKGH
jgi:hypothetical protein